MVDDIRSDGPQFVLDSVRNTLRQLASSPLDAPPHQAESLVVIARDLERLVEVLITDIVSLASKSSTSPALETLLTGNDTAPPTQARTEIERQRVGTQFPAVEEARRNGSAKTANVDTLARLTQRLTDDELEDLVTHDAELADAASRLGISSFRKRVTRLRNRIRTEHGTDPAEQALDDSYARVTPTKERDAYRLHGRYDPVRGATLHAALDRETRFLAEHPDLCIGETPEQIAAQALCDLILRGDSIDRNATPRAAVQIHVLSDWDTLASGPHTDSICETFEGLDISTNTLDRLCCDATMRAIRTTPDADVHVARSTRTATTAQRAALRALYPECPISGTGWEAIEIHHVVFYEESGHTVLSELIPVSRRWHHLIHDEGWQLTMDPDRTVHVSRPDGTAFRTIPPPVPINQADHDLAA